MCPIEGLWVHYTELAHPQLLACESRGACGTLDPGQPCKDWLNDTQTERVGAKCSDSTTGFMCAECRAGYNKVNGNCVVCDGLSASTLATNLIFQLLTAVFLVYNSTTTIVTEHEVERCITRTYSGIQPIFSYRTRLTFVKKAPVYHIMRSGTGGGFRPAAIHSRRPEGCICHAQPLPPVLQQDRRTNVSS